LSSGGSHAKHSDKVLLNIFLESSTRTKASFSLAAQRMGIHVTEISKSYSSLDKGESVEDTLSVLAAMKPDVITLRCSSSDHLKYLASVAECPVINAGDGTNEHPTQALINAFTLSEVLTLSGAKILFVGDCANSRVFNSTSLLCEKLGARAATLTFKGLEPLTAGYDAFSDKKEALDWADAVIGLRIQRERMSDEFSINRQQIDEIQITSDDLAQFKNRHWILHPGPIGWGDEFAISIKSYPKNLVLKMVNRGIHIRVGTLEWLLE